jgi:hypothetical protein
MQVFKVVLQRTEMEIGRVQKLVTFLCLFGVVKRLAGRRPERNQYLRTIAELNDGLNDGGIHCRPERLCNQTGNVNLWRLLELAGGAKPLYPTTEGFSLCLFSVVFSPKFFLRDIRLTTLRMQHLPTPPTVRQHRSA